MSEQRNVKANDGSMDEIVKFRVRSDDKEKIRDYFGSFSDMREYVIRVVETKGEDVKREDKK